jgi:rhodanese-related sulfurtransferase
MYNSLHTKLKPLPGNVTVYPAHGAGTLCGKSLSDAKNSNMEEEKKTNWSLQQMSEKEFVDTLLSEQPFVPLYFPFDVELNKKGAQGFKENTDRVKIDGAIKNETDAERLNKELWIIDARDEKVYKKGHLHHSLNIMNENKFETWLGSIIHPKEKFYLISESKDQLIKLIERSAAIGYEPQIEEAFVIDYTNEHMDKMDVAFFKEHEDAFTIIDVRNVSEAKENKIFSNSISIPLHELREKVNAILTAKPLVVHCASGFRSAAGSSLIQSKLKNRVKVFDLGEAIKSFMKEKKVS